MKNKAIGKGKRIPIKKRVVDTRDKHIGLCYRCEERANFLETGYGSRYECQTPNANVCSCYMYKPVKPVVTKVALGYGKRPRFAPAAVCAREQAVKVHDKVELKCQILSNGDICLYWKPC